VHNLFVFILIEVKLITDVVYIQII